ncbi:hypothetical protein [Streptomyces hebeiensis]
MSGNGDSTDTAADEVFKEVEEAETRLPGEDEGRGGESGGAGDALSPNQGAQEDAESDKG